jgi:TRAP transporter 4TM/12TM fusion protein
VTARLEKILLYVAIAVAVGMSLFHLYTGGFRLLPGQQQRAIHLGLALILIFLLFPARKGIPKDKQGKWNWLNLVLAAAGFLVGGYLFTQFEPMSFRAGVPNTWDMVIGVSLVILVLEASRRVLGWSLAVVAAVFLGYAFFGDNLPMAIRHTGYSFERIVSEIALSTEGILGTALGVSASYVALFVIFGAFLEQSGVGQFFINLALAGFGKMRGGPAKAAIGASSLFGMISGSQVANVVSTGVLTIPLMKKSGYQPEFAGAVEAVASTGGMFLPPVMGATAFLIAEVLQVNYVDVAIAAALPAVLYYLALYVMVDLRAARLGLEGVNSSELPNTRLLLKEKSHLFIPLLVLIVFLFVVKDSPTKAAFWSIVCTPVACFLSQNTRMSLKSIFTALEKGARLTLVVASACATAGIIIGVINLSGLGLRLSGMLISLAGGNLLLLLILTMIASLILGMGLPPVAAYIVLAVLAAPALISMNVDPMAAHLFILYFGIVSAITPPVALAAYAAAGLARCSAVKTGFVAFRLALVAFIVPFQFALEPTLLLKGNLTDTVISAFSALIGVIALAIALEGYFKRSLSLVSRVVLGIGALMLVNVGIVTDLIGYILVAVILFQEWRVPVQRQALDMARAEVGSSVGRATHS